MLCPASSPGVCGGNLQACQPIPLLECVPFNVFFQPDALDRVGRMALEHRLPIADGQFYSCGAYDSQYGYDGSFLTLAKAKSFFTCGHCSAAGNWIPFSTDLIGVDVLPDPSGQQSR